MGLFSGIGGFEIGLQREGHQVIRLCEIESTARTVLERALPDVTIDRDIQTMRSLPSGTELLVAGFPCQDLSQAGLTAGLAGKRSGLVEHVFGLLQRKRVPWVLLENVPFMLHLDRGRAMAEIIERFESLGYRWAYRIVDSRAFGVPQRRRRVVLLASKSGDPRRILFADEAGEPSDACSDPIGKVACGFYWTEGNRGVGWAVDAVPTLKGGSGVGIPSPPAIVLPNLDVVTPDITDAERMQGFEPNWTLVADQDVRASQRWKLVGNAVTVDVARWIGYRLRRPATDATEVPSVRLPKGAPWPGAAWSLGTSKGRWSAHVSAFPRHVDHEPLVDWLRAEPHPLSAKATRGFLSRAKASSLSFAPRFLEALEAHLERMERSG